MAVTSLYIGIRIEAASKPFSDSAERKKHRFVTNPEINLGTVSQNENCVARFQVRNATSDKLLIHDITRSCSCAEVEFESKELAPNSTSNILVYWKTLQGHGKTELPLQLIYSLSANASKINFESLLITAEIEPDYHYPMQVTFNEVNSQQIFTISSGRKQVPQLLRVSTSHENINARLIDESTVIVELKDNLMRNGKYFIQIETSDTLNRWILIPVTQLNVSVPNLGSNK